MNLGMECMGERCGVLVPEDFLCSILRDQNLGARYSKLCFMDLIKVMCMCQPGDLLLTFCLSRQRLPRFLTQLLLFFHTNCFSFYIAFVTITCSKQSLI